MDQFFFSMAIILRVKLFAGLERETRARITKPIASPMNAAKNLERSVSWMLKKLHRLGAKNKPRKKKANGNPKTSKAARLPSPGLISRITSSPTAGENLPFKAVICLVADFFSPPERPVQAWQPLHSGLGLTSTVTVVSCTEIIFPGRLITIYFLLGMYFFANQNMIR